MVQAFQKERIFSLDILRGLAAMLVLFRHAPTDLVPASSLVENAYQFIHRIGWSGVDLFFVLSGFLIGKLLIDELEENGRIHFARFWIRRSFKIWPSYFAAYGSVFLLQCLRDLLIGNYPLLRQRIIDTLPNVIFIQNYVRCERWPHSWSLAVEEHFYLVLPLLLTLLALRVDFRVANNTFLRRMIASMAFIGVAALSLRLWNDARGAAYGLNYYQSHLRADSLFFGVFLNSIFRFGSVRGCGFMRWLFPGLLVLIAAFYVLSRYPLKEFNFSASWGFTLLYLGYGSLVLAAACRPDAGRDGPYLVRAICSMLAWVGVYSYTIYLCHAILFAIPGFDSGRKHILMLLSQGETPVPWWLVYGDRLAFISISIAGGVILSRLVERPFLRMRSRCFP